MTPPSPNFVWTVLFLTAVPVLLSACAGKPELDTGAAAGATEVIRRSRLGDSVEGRPIEALEVGNGPVVYLALATIHGSEPAGTPLLLRLAEEVAAKPALAEGKTVVLVPVVNPDGFALKKRGNARGVDLNRNFPAGNFQASTRHGDTALSEPESRVLKSLLRERRPARIVSLHQPLSCVDYDGPGAHLAAAMAAGGPLPVRKLGSRPGSLGSYAGVSLGIPIITLELPGGAEGLGSAELWDRYGGTLVAWLEAADPDPADAKVRR